MFPSSNLSYISFIAPFQIFGLFFFLTLFFFKLEMNVLNLFH